MLNWLNQFSICCFLNNNEYSSPYSSYECLAAAGATAVFEPEDEFFTSLSSFTSLNDDWIFGHFSYDLKNKADPALNSQNIDGTHLPEFFLFVPEIVLLLKQNELVIGVLADNADKAYNDIVSSVASVNAGHNPLNISARVSRDEYLNTIQKIQQHIQYGDCYEINYCQEFYANGEIKPLSTFWRLNQLSPNPFSAYYKLLDKYLLCASPERFIKKFGDTIISQPIKGTAPRDLTSTAHDEQNKKQLFQSSKERSENVMIVDLVRNDLSKICAEGSVAVEELFGVYSYPTVHQMISTVKGRVGGDVDFAKILKATFPMGSMTGAPKRRVMELIEQYEQSKRGIYSGTVGYITPEGDFDFNVVIRSLVYNAASQYVSFHVGSAITAASNAEEEYEECLLKGKSLMKLFGKPVA